MKIVSKRVFDEYMVRTYGDEYTDKVNQWVAVVVGGDEEYASSEICYSREAAIGQVKMRYRGMVKADEIAVSSVEETEWDGD